jgi:hypothetical protein
MSLSAPLTVKTVEYFLIFFTVLGLADILLGSFGSDKRKMLFLLLAATMFILNVGSLIVIETLELSLFFYCCGLLSLLVSVMCFIYAYRIKQRIPEYMD